jgi:hypothetical protein
MVILGPMMTILEGNLQQGTIPNISTPSEFSKGAVAGTVWAFCAEYKDIKHI